jgi:DtxR family transcriptional regulator, Mn-dependent transcriptional regulator
MENLSQTEENYLKAIFKICEQEEKPASTNAIAGEMNTAAASVSDMLKRLAGKELIHYEKHRGVTLSESGNQIATMLVRKHRLWEVFLVKTLDFSWDEVHEMAEELEHVQSPELIDRLDKFLGHPRFDPHGDPIPDAHGNFASRKQVQLSDLEEGESGVVVGVQEHSSVFLQYLDKMSLGLGAEVCVKEIFEFDGSLKISIGNQQEIIISSKVSENLLVQKTK